MGGNLQFVAKRKRSEKEWKPESEQTGTEVRCVFPSERYFKLTSAFSGFVVMSYGQYCSVMSLLKRKSW